MGTVPKTSGQDFIKERAPTTPERTGTFVALLAVEIHCD